MLPHHAPARGPSATAALWIPGVGAEGGLPTLLLPPPLGAAARASSAPPPPGLLPRGPRHLPAALARASTPPERDLWAGGERGRGGLGSQFSRGVWRTRACEGGAPWVRSEGKEWEPGGRGGEVRRWGVTGKWGHLWFWKGGNCAEEGGGCPSVGLEGERVNAWRGSRGVVGGVLEGGRVYRVGEATSGAGDEGTRQGSLKGGRES